MYRGVVWVLFFGMCSGAYAQSQPAAGELLPRFRGALRETLRQLPDYTCIETIARTRRSSAQAPFEPLDTIRVQVGLIGGKERYAWPDAARFDDRELRDLAGRGVIGTGNFASHVQHVFLSPATQFTAAGGGILDGHNAARFDYALPVEYSRYTIRVPPHEAEVGVRGSFWFDPSTLDLLRLEVLADEIPPELGLAGVNVTIGYARTRIGDSDFLLPNTSQLTMTSPDGGEYRNQITFGECRQFRAQSQLRTEIDDAGANTPVPGAAGTALPASLSIDLTLDSDIDPETAAIGDSVQAVVSRPVRDDTSVLVPDGAVVHGRLVRLERSALPFDHYVVGLEFHTIEAAGARFDFFATMQSAGPASGLLQQAKRLKPVFTRKRTGRFDILVREKPRGEGILHWDAKRAPIRRGLKMRWLTADPAGLAP